MTAGPDGERSQRAQALVRPVLWAYLVWVILSWTRTTEQLVVGMVLADAAAVVCAELEPVAAPWSLLGPRRLIGVAKCRGWATGVADCGKCRFSISEIVGR